MERNETNRTNWTNADARAHFQSLGLTYADIRASDIARLWRMCERNLMNYALDGGRKALQMDMRMRPLRDGRAAKYKSDGTLVYALLSVDGSYFSGRQAIEFDMNGYIAFCAELDSANSQPILAAFAEWADLLAWRKAREAADSGDIGGDTQ